MQIGVITNPRSRKNKNRPRRAARLQSLIGRLGEVHETPDVASIKPVIRDFLRKRAQYWVADGGDGALHWMLRSAMEVLSEEEFAAQGAEMPLTLPTNGGTIDFVAHNAGVRGDAEGLLVALRSMVESGRRIDEVEVDSMAIDAVEATPDGDRAIRTYGFASAVGGIGQRFFTKYLEERDPNPRSILKILAGAVASMPAALPLIKHAPLVPAALRRYAGHMYRPTGANVRLDGAALPYEDFTAIHVASMSINLGGVFRFFTKADAAGQLHALVGTPSPLTLVRNLPRMHMGKEFHGRGIVDRACRIMTVEARGDELLAPIVDGEMYANLRSITFGVGPRVRIPKLTAKANQA
jgi:hypothetical protein